MYFLCSTKFNIWEFPGGSEDKASACHAGDQGSIPGLVRSPGEGNGNPLQNSCLENPMDRGDWPATVHGVTESDTTERVHFTSQIQHLARIKNHFELSFRKSDNFFFWVLTSLSAFSFSYWYILSFKWFHSFINSLFLSSSSDLVSHIRPEVFSRSAKTGLGC